MSRAAILWLAACIAGSAAFVRGDFRPGRLGAALPAWPDGSALSRAADRTTVVAFLHPRCPCTRGTVTRLLESVRHEGAQAHVVAVAFAPGETQDPAWTDGAYLQRIRRELPEAEVALDRDGAEARRFHVWTSGTILAYDRAGREVFRGGITARRGAGEDNASSRTFLGRVTADDGRAESAPVFGCPILAEDAT